ncbi:hypothetical protein MSAN_00021400 [Mycena sanguinolenta]|uniref:Uncharacterized protein n=1 Tax=Mycena sanguinolenta TaxID=230812 RepID=A0A8H6ZFR1_9AGAR|nr:hypothetical protein MSAN_00021400 [Mycena sanguinolenta]
MSSLMDEKMSVLSDRTLCASPEPLPPPPRITPSRVAHRPTPAQHPDLRAHYNSHRIRSMERKPLLVSCRIFPTCEGLGRTSIHSSTWELQMRIVLAWAVCSALLVLTAAAVFLSTLVRRPPVKFVRLLHVFSILMSATTCILGFAVLFPVIAECSSAAGCSSSDHTARFFLCGGVPVASVWTWLWIPNIRRFSSALEQQ